MTLGAPGEPRALDGVTILRYAHIHRRRVSGGVEQYLRQLNHGLLQRHRLTLLQMYLTDHGSPEPADIENIGLGRLVWLPIAYRRTTSVLGGLPARIAFVCRRASMRRPHNSPALFDAVRRYAGHLRHAVPVWSEPLADALGVRNVDLLALHWVHYDVGQLIRRAASDGVPYVLINHFDNGRLTLRETRRWTAGASGIGTVSSNGLPEELREKCTTLSDAVDTEWFDPDKARSRWPTQRAIVFLPARIAPDKGHDDLLRAGAILVSQKLDIEFWFAGAVESEALMERLHISARAMGLQGRVHFWGERNAEEMRDLYASSDVVVLPSHAEGLGRVLLEAQSMKRAVIAYDCGGMGSAVQPGKTGVLAPRGDIRGLADAIGRLLADESQRLRLGECGRRFVSEEFSVSKLIERHERFYLDALGASHRVGARSICESPRRAGR
jgi:glycosyltransferase involved in cell wall biosynthesis